MRYLLILLAALLLSLPASAQGNPRDSVDALRTRLGLPADLPGQAERFSYTDDQRGVTGLWSLHAAGLGEDGGTVELDVVKADEIFRRFVKANAAMLGVSGVLALANPELTNTPGEVISTGNRIQLLSYDQVVHGHFTTAGRVRAMFVNGVLVSFNGRLIADDAPYNLGSGDVASAISAAVAEEEQRSGLGAESYNVSTLYDFERRALVHLVDTRSQMSTEMIPDGQTYRVDARTGVVLSSRPAGKEYPSPTDAEYNRNYTVGTTYGTDSSPWKYNQVTTTAPAIYEWSSGYYFPWSSSYTTPVPTFSRLTSAGEHISFATTGHFTATPTGTPEQFAQQHILVWTRLGAYLADGSWGWSNLYPSAGKYTALVAIPNKTTAPAKYWRDCPFDMAYHPLQANPCITTNSNGSVQVLMTPCPTPTNADCPANFGAIWHEFGHHAGDRLIYPNDRYNYGCEQKALDEGIAGIFSLSGAAQIYGTGSNIARYIGHYNTNQGPGFSGYLTGYGAPGAVHQNNGPALACYDDGASCNTYGFGGYAVSLYQAHWEVTHEKNCDVSCVNYGVDESVNPVLDAKYAAGYGAWATPASGSMRTFVANYLTHFYYGVGYNAWNNRWWTFNHHNLVGPPPSSPC